MKRITIGCKAGEELYRTGHRRALSELRFQPYHDRKQWQYREPFKPYVVGYYGTPYPEHTDWDLLADMHNLATWNEESADTTAQRVKRIMEQGCNA